MSAFVLALWHLFTNTTLECRDYFEWQTVNSQTSGSVHDASIMLVLALGALFLVDVIRPKPARIAIWTRAFQFLLIASLASVTFLQHGLLYPGGPVTGWARNYHLALQHLPLIAVEEFLMEGYCEFDRCEPHDARSALPRRTFEDISPFFMKAGLLRCEVDRQVEALRSRRLEIRFLESAYPIAITEIPPE